MRVEVPQDGRFETWGGRGTDEAAINSQSLRQMHGKSLDVVRRKREAMVGFRANQSREALYCVDAAHRASLGIALGQQIARIAHAVGSASEEIGIERQ